MDDALAISDEQTVPLDDIGAGLHGLRVLFVNVFAVEADAGWTLVDAGLRGSAGRIRRWAHSRFGDSPPQAIVLTHGHFDHVGTLDELLRTWPVPVYVHDDELPYVTGARSYPPPDPWVGGGLMARLAAVYPRGPIDVSEHVRRLPPDSSLPTLPGWRWLHTPGHTAGHVSLFRDADRTLLVGDAFCTTNQASLLAVATQRPELHGPPAYYTTDWEAARASVERLAALKPETLAPGHGQPLAGAEATRGLDTLAESFDRLGWPPQGRYLARPVRG